MQDLIFQGDAASLGTCATTIEGTVQNGDASMNIQVKVPALQQTVKVTFFGVKQVEESGKDWSGRGSNKIVGMNYADFTVLRIE